MDKTKRINYWRELAEYDLSVAEVMLNNGKYLYVGFMCHLVVEKLLKAYHIKTMSIEAPRIHNLERLANISNVYSELSDEQKHLLEVLSPFNIESRYPSDKELLFRSLDDAICQKIFKLTKEFFLWISPKF
jgi:HEPN domain-containing protein